MPRQTSRIARETLARIVDSVSGRPYAPFGRLYTGLPPVISGQDRIRPAARPGPAGVPGLGAISADAGETLQSVLFDEVDLDTLPCIICGEPHGGPHRVPGGTIADFERAARLIDDADLTRPRRPDDADALRNALASPSLLAEAFTLLLTASLSRPCLTCGATAGEPCRDDSAGEPAPVSTAAGIWQLHDASPPPGCLPPPPPAAVAAWLGIIGDPAPEFARAYEPPVSSVTAAELLEVARQQQAALMAWMRRPGDLDELPDDTELTVAAGPGRDYEAWVHAAHGIWYAAPSEPTEDRTAEQVTAGDLRALLAARG